MFTLSWENRWCSSDYNIFVVRFGADANELLIIMVVSWIFIWHHISYIPDIDPEWVESWKS